MQHRLIKVAWNLFLIVTGSLLCAVAINGILIPNRFLAGGISGLSLFIFYLFPFIPVGVSNFLLNIPLFVLGWMFVADAFFSTVWRGWPFFRRRCSSTFRRSPSTIRCSTP